ncbi:MAG: hypothetical protein KDA75_12520, partial [Planctomycetaceae bacterium]|nr:hypothetical protein [Planctomycetaceae bacterium]
MATLLMEVGLVGCLNEPPPEAEAVAVASTVDSSAQEAVDEPSSTEADEPVLVVEEPDQTPEGMVWV